jgi:hypothetical protein
MTIVAIGVINRAGRTALLLVSLSGLALWTTVVRQQSRSGTSASRHRGAKPTQWMSRTCEITSSAHGADRRR